MILRKACFPLRIMIVFSRKRRSGKGMPQKAGYGILLTAESCFGRLKQDKQDGQSTGGGKIHDTSTIKICDNDSGLWFHE